MYLRNSNSQGIADRRYYFGDPGDYPLAGDWNGDGCDTVSLWRQSEQRVYVINRLESEAAGLGAVEYWYAAGAAGQVPVVFDHNDNGVDSVAFHDPLTGRVTVEGTESYFGDPGDRLVSGRWDGPPSLGAFRPGTRVAYTYGSCRDGDRRWLPVTAAAPAPSVEAVVVRLNDAEREALGPSVVVTVTWSGGAAILDDCAPELAIDAAPGTTVTARYLDARGNPTEIEWQQTLEANTLIRQPWRVEETAPGDIILAWQSTGDSARYLREIDAAPGLTVTSPIRWRLNADGSVSGRPDAGFIASAHARGIEVWPAVAILDADRIALAMDDPAGLAELLSVTADQAGADGVNIDQ